MAADQAGGMAVSGVPPGYAVPPIGGTILPGGTAPPMGGTVSCCLSAAWHDACFCRHDVMPSIDGTVSRRRIRRRKSGAGQPPGTASGGGVAASPTGCRRGRQRASLQEPPDPAAFRRRQPAPPQPGAGFWGRRWASFASRPVRCRQLTARYVVPAIAGTAWCRLVRCRQSAARFRPATEKRGTAGSDGALRGCWGVL